MQSRVGAQHASSKSTRLAHAHAPPGFCIQFDTRYKKCNCKASLVPSSVIQELKYSNKQWLQQTISSSHSLHDNETGCIVHLLGVSFLAPQQHRLVEAAIDEVEPSHILIEQPPDQPPDVVLPHPSWIQVMLDYSVEISAAIHSLTDAGTVQSQQALQQQLLNVCHTTAKVGRDIIDPVETFGYYPGLDLFMNPAAAATAVNACGFLPGEELLVAAEHAMTHGANLSCIDAPLKLQENWVRQLLDNFTLTEQQVNSYKPLKDFEQNQQMMPPAAAEWDRQLAAAAQDLQAAVAAGTAAKDHAAAVASSSARAAEQQSLLLYKVSKATAAAMLSPEDTPQVIERMQRLQPLKWAHFRLRQRYMAQQIREACSVAAAAAGRNPSGRKTAAGQQPPGKKPIKMLAIVGRQYVHGLRELWRNPESPLWKDRVPKTFSPSVVEKVEDFAATGRQQQSSTGGSEQTDGNAQGVAAQV